MTKELNSAHITAKYSPIKQAPVAIDVTINFLSINWCTWHFLVGWEGTLAVLVLNPYYNKS